MEPSRLYAISFKIGHALVISEQGDLLSACPPPPNPDLHPHHICWYTTATNLGSDHLLIIGNIARWRRCGFEKPSLLSLWCEFRKLVAPELFFFFLFNISPFQFVLKSDPQSQWLHLWIFTDYLEDDRKQVRRCSPRGPAWTMSSAPTISTLAHSL